jgi:uncharacterized protein (TIGR02996 family)
MGTEGPFLRDICEHPAEDAPRLVYADWLEDNGQPEQGEFIRIQCELARSGGEVSAARLRQLTRREKQLWQKHGAAWEAGELRVRQGLPFWRRGFPATAYFAGGMSTCVSGLADLVRRFPIEVLWIVYQGLTSREVAELADLRFLGQISELELFNNGYFNDPGLGPQETAILAGSPHLARLERLVLTGNQIGKDGLEALACSPHLPSLRVLRLHDGSLDDECVRLLADSPLAARLTGLRLGGNTRRITDESAHILAHTPAFAGLTELVLENVAIGDGGVRHLAHSPHLVGLRELTIYQADVGDGGAGALAGSPQLRRLHKLVLRHNHISSAGARALAGSGHLPQGLYLDLAANYDYPAAVVRALRQRFKRVNFDDSRRP